MVSHLPDSVRGGPAIIRLDGLGYAVGLLFADYFMFRRLSYIDPETGFYNEKYLAVMERKAVNKAEAISGTAIETGTGIWRRAADEL